VSAGTSRPRHRWAVAGSLLLGLIIVVVGVLIGNSDGTKTPASSPTTVSPSQPNSPTPAKSLTARSASVASDALFLSEVTEVDPGLVTYEKEFGNVALRSLLTDGSAFCAFLDSDRDIDTAMVSVVVGARHVEVQTHLPLSVTTFNAVDSVALLTLCPTLQSKVPTSDLAKIRQLGEELAVPSN